MLPITDGTVSGTTPIVVFMSWIDMIRGRRSDDGEATWMMRELREALDPHGERTMIDTGDGNVAVIPGNVLHNIAERMERIDLDPDTDWAPEDLMTLIETLVMFTQLGFGELVVTQTAWTARQILSRWPLELVEHPIPPEAHLDLFIEGLNLDPRHGDIARQVINRALASSTEVEEHPELDDLTAEDLMSVWLGVVFWFGIKSHLLNGRAPIED